MRHQGAYQGRLCRLRFSKASVLCISGTLHGPLRCDVDFFPRKNTSYFTYVLPCLLLFSIGLNISACMFLKACIPKAAVSSSVIHPPETAYFEGLNLANSIPVWFYEVRVPFGIVECSTGAECLRNCTKRAGWHSRIRNWIVGYIWIGLLALATGHIAPECCTHLPNLFPFTLFSEVTFEVKKSCILLLQDTVWASLWV